MVIDREVIFTSKVENCEVKIFFQIIGKLLKINSGIFLSRDSDSIFK